MSIINRWIFGLCLAFFLGMSGCSNEWQDLPSTNEFGEFGDRPFPLRQDWLVVSTPKAPVTKWFEAGLPPLTALDLPPNQWNNDQKAFFAEKTSNNILNCKSLPTEEKITFAKGLTKYFGTMRQPKIEPITEEMKPMIEDLHLEPETLATGGLLFESYCSTCHGSTGAGDGPAGKFLIPLPRDYRQGLFKFLTAQPQNFGAKPQRVDLKHTIQYGMVGAGMPAFYLEENQIEAIISYVIFLSIRGECEYSTMKNSLKDGVDDYAGEITSALKRILPRWWESNKQPMKLDENPYADEHPQRAYEKKLISAALGYKVFLDGKKGACTTCHVNYGRSSPYQYDSWGTVVQPRNLMVGILRAGREDHQIYARILGGIPGSGMPSHAHLIPKSDETGVLITPKQHPLWNVVHFVQALGDVKMKSQIQQFDYMKKLFEKYEMGDPVQVKFD